MMGIVNGGEEVMGIVNGWGRIVNGWGRGEVHRETCKGITQYQQYKCTRRWHSSIYSTPDVEGGIILFKAHHTCYTAAHQPI